MTTTPLSLQCTLLGQEHLLADNGVKLPCEITADGLLWLENANLEENISCTDQAQEIRLLLAPANPGPNRPARLSATAAAFTLAQAQLAGELLEAPSLAAPWPAERGARMVQHMNEDHADAVRHYFRLKGVVVTEAHLLSVDPCGMWLSSGDLTLRFPFDTPALDPVAVREALVSLARLPLPS